MRILIVEDERKLAQILASALAEEHYDVVFHVELPIAPPTLTSESEYATRHMGGHA